MLYIYICHLSYPIIDPNFLYSRNWWTLSTSPYIGHIQGHLELRRTENSGPFSAKPIHIFCFWRIIWITLIASCARLVSGRLRHLEAPSTNVFLNKMIKPQRIKRLIHPAAQTNQKQPPEEPIMIMSVAFSPRTKAAVATNWRSKGRTQLDNPTSSAESNISSRHSAPSNQYIQRGGPKERKQVFCTRWNRPGNAQLVKSRTSSESGLKKNNIHDRIESGDYNLFQCALNVWTTRFLLDHIMCSFKAYTHTVLPLCTLASQVAH